MLLWFYPQCPLRMLVSCRCFPLAGILYYILGASIFGVLRGLETQEILMFPMEFTTNRHLEDVSYNIFLIIQEVKDWFKKIIETGHIVIDI